MVKLLIYAAIGAGMFCKLAQAQPVNDPCGTPMVMNVGANAVGTFTAQSTLTNATAQAGEWFTDVQTTAGHTARTIWFRFDLPAARQAVVSVSSNQILAHEAGVTVFKTSGPCPPGPNEYLAAGLPSIQSLGEIFTTTGCLPPGNYLIQVAGGANVSGTINVSLTLSLPNPQYDLAAAALNFGTVSGTTPWYNYVLGCHSTESGEPACPLAAGYTQSSWHVFSTDVYLDRLIFELNALTPGVYPFTFGFQIYQGDCRTQAFSQLIPVGPCQLITHESDVNTPQNQQTCTLFPQTIYSVQLFFPPLFRSEVRVRLRESGVFPAQGANPANLPGSMQLGELQNGVPVSIEDVLGCTALMTENSCGANMPDFTVFQGDTFRYNTWTTFTLSDDGMLNVQVTPQNALILLYAGDIAAVSDYCNLPLMYNLSMENEICNVPPNVYSLQILTQELGETVNVTIEYLNSPGFYSPQNPEVIGSVIEFSEGTVDYFSCEPMALSQIQSLIFGAAGEFPGAYCDPPECDGVSYGLCPGEYMLCDSTYNRFIFRKFRLNQPKAIEIKNTSGSFPFVFMRGEIDDPQQTLFLMTSCTEYYRTNPCEPLPAGWYSVVSFGKSINVGSPTNVQISILDITDFPVSQFNVPENAATCNAGLPLRWQVVQTGESVRSYRTYNQVNGVPSEYVGCTADTPYVHIRPCCPSWFYNRVSHYVFWLDQESYVLLNPAAGDTNVQYKLYAGNARLNPEILLTDDAVIQPCRRCNYTEFCRLQPGAYTLVMFIHENLIAAAPINPTILVDRVAPSRYDHASRAYDAGPLPPGEWLEAEADFISCATGAQGSDPPIAPGAFPNLCETGLYPPDGPDTPYPMPANTYLYPDWFPPDTVVCGSNRRNLWYSFQVQAAGHVEIKVDRLTSGVPPLPFSVWRAEEMNGALPLTQTEIDSTEAQGLVFIANNLESTNSCVFTPSLNFYQSSCDPVRYFLLVDNRSLFTHKVRPTFRFIPDVIYPGDLCTGAVGLELPSAPSNAAASTQVQCHTIGEGYGEDGSNMGCLGEAGALQSTWFRVSVGGEEYQRFNLSFAVNTAAPLAAFRVLYGDCSAMTPFQCGAAAGFTVTCMPPGDYYIQLVTPAGTTGEVELTASSALTPDQNCERDLPPVVASFAYTTDCSSTEVRFLNQSSSGSNIVYEWTFDVEGGCCGFSTAKNPRVSYPVAGEPKTYRVRLKVRNTQTNAERDTFMDVAVYPPVGAVEIAANRPLCDGGQIELFVPPGFASYLWSTGQTQNVVQVSEPGVYSVTVTSANGCSATTERTVSSFASPVVEIERTSADCSDGYTACFTARVNGGVPPYVYAWNGQVGTEIQCLSTGTHQLTVTDASGCATQTTWTVAAPPDPLPILVSRKEYLCPGETTVFSAPEGYVYEWRDATGQIVSQMAQVVAAPPFFATLAVTNSGGCTAQADFRAEILTESVVRVDKQEVCVGRPMRLSAVMTTVEGDTLQGFDIAWIDETTGLVFGRGAELWLTDAEGDKNFRVEGTYRTCPVPAPVGVEARFLSTPRADFTHSPEKIETPDGKTHFANLTTGADFDSLRFEWTMDGKSYVVAEPTHIFSEPGLYPVRLIATHLNSGCADTIIKTVEVVKLIENVYVPNIFTPNGDGVNDFFSVKILGFERLEMEIYDRWGTMVFSGANNWNGKFLNKGENCPAGVYFYVVKAYRLDGRVFHRTGSVTLTR